MPTEIPDLKRVSVGALITETKLEGSMTAIRGFTEPEDWPFLVLAIVIRPGNEQLMDLVAAFAAKAATLVPPVRRQDWAEWPRKPE